MPTKEEVLKWYESLSEALKKEGMDINNPGDLIRIEMGYFNELENAYGNISQCTADRRYAFMPRTKNEDGKYLDYVSKEPDVLSNPLGEQFPEEEMKFANALTNRNTALDNLLQARKKKESLEKIEKLEEEYNKLDKAYLEANKQFMNYKNRLFSEYDKWMLSNLKPFDVEKDYDLIEDLFLRAKDGGLSIRAAGSDPLDVKQIYVNAQGQAAVSKSFADPTIAKDKFGDISIYLGKSEESKNRLMERYNKALDAFLAGKPENEREMLRKEYENPQPLIDLPKPPQEPKKPKYSGRRQPQEVAKPGILSWIKRIVTFGRNKEDFENYDNYVTELNAYEADVRKFKGDSEKYLADYAKYETDLTEYNDHLEETKAQTLKHNNENIKKYKMLLDYEAGKDYEPGTPDIAMLSHNQSEFVRSILAEIPPIELDSEEVYLYKKQHNFELSVEVKENPKSFEKDFSRNVQASDEYWKEKITINSEEIKERNKTNKKLNAGTLQDEKNKIFSKDKLKTSEENQKTIESIKTRSAKFKEIQEVLKDNDALKKLYETISKGDDKYVYRHRWVVRPLNQCFEKIGALLGGDSKLGEKAFVAAMMQNQVTKNNGELVDAKTNEECINDLKTLISYAYRTELPEGSGKFIDRMKTLAQNEYSPVEIVDSFASSIATDVDYNFDIDTVNHASAMASIYLNNIVEKNKMNIPENVLNGEGGIRKVNGEDVSLSNGNDIETALNVSQQCIALQKGYQQVEKMKASLKKDADVKDLDVKRPLNI